MQNFYFFNFKSRKYLSILLKFYFQFLFHLKLKWKFVEDSYSFLSVVSWKCWPNLIKCLTFYTDLPWLHKIWFSHPYKFHRQKLDWIIWKQISIVCSIWRELFHWLLFEFLIMPGGRPMRIPVSNSRLTRPHEGARRGA